MELTRSCPGVYVPLTHHAQSTGDTASALAVMRVLPGEDASHLLERFGHWEELAAVMSFRGDVAGAAKVLHRHGKHERAAVVLLDHLDQGVVAGGGQVRGRTLYATRHGDHCFT